LVVGLDIFRDHFSDYTDRYVLIGGTACSVIMADVGLEFRATKDLDIVLYVEALDEDFVSKFWDFISKGKYQNRQKSTGKEVFYRFYSPAFQGFPSMLELFSRKPDSVSLEGGGHLTPIPTTEAAASLSAILLDDEYYHFIHSGKVEIAGISLVDAGHLIPLKARAWLDLLILKQSGGNVDERDIRKHKNDVLPDKLMGQNIRNALQGTKEIKLYDGSCYVHEEFTTQDVERLRADHPNLSSRMLRGGG